MASTPSPNSINATSEYSSTACTLALDVSPPASTDSQKPSRPQWPRSQSMNSRTALWTRRRSSSPTNQSLSQRALRTSDKYLRKSLLMYSKLTFWQKVALSSFGLISILLGLLGFIFHDKLFKWFLPKAEKWEKMPAGWLILWAVTFTTAFPPMIGYSTCVTLAGFVWGMKGWFIIATANVVGSLGSFLFFRHKLSNFATKLAARDPRFAAFGLVIAHDGITMLTLIRLTPLPYSFSNAGLSTVHTIRPWAFVVATAIATPKLLIHVFIGTRIKQLAEGREDPSTKILNVLSIVFGIILGAVIGWVIFRRTMARAKALEAEERRKEAAANPRSGRMEHPDVFEEDEDDAIEVAGDIIDFVYADEENQAAGQHERYVDDDEDDDPVDGKGGIGMKRTGKFS